MGVRNILTIAGYVVGSYFGYPQLGLIIGSLVGNAVDPVKIYGPKLSDAKIQTARDGVPINWGAGVFRCAGTIIAIQPGPPTQHEHSEGGKGGGPQQVTYTYTRTHAILVCEGPVIGIRRIWRDQKLVYDTSPEPTEPFGTMTMEETLNAWRAAKAATAKFSQGLAIYLGDETQMPDAELEALFGAGEVPAHRGYCYVRKKDDDVTDRAGSIANYEFEVVKAGTTEEVSFANFVSTGTYAPGTVYGSEDGDNWNAITGVAGGESLKYSTTDGVNVYAWSAVGNIWKSSDNGQTWTQTASGLTNILKMAYGNGVIVAIQDTGSGYRALYSADGAAWGGSPIITTVTAFNDLHFGQGVFAATFGNTFGVSPPIYWSSSGGLWTAASFSGADVLNIWFNGDEWMASVGDHVILASNIVATWTTGAAPVSGRAVFAIVGGPGYWLASVDLNGIYRSILHGISWSLVQSTSAQLREATIAGTAVVFSPGGAGSTGVFTSHDAGQSFALASGISDGVSISAVTGVGPDSIYLPDSVNWYVDSEGNYHTTGTVNTVISETVTLASFLQEICRRSDLDASMLDTSDIDDLLTGFVIARETQGGALINVLQLAFLFDVCEQDGLLCFIKRGGASQVSLDADDLVAVNDTCPVRETRDQEIERPRKINVLYFDPKLQYIPSKQTAERIASVSAVGETSIELPVVLDKDEAAQIADKLIKISWTDLLGTASFALPVEFSYLVPSDIVTLTYRDRVRRLRIEKLDEESGVLMIQSRQDRLSAIDSNATGIGDPQSPPNVTPVTATIFAAMNLPYLRPQDNTPGIYFAARGATSGWPGCVVQISYDGGASYVNAVTITNSSVMGNLTAPVDDPANSPSSEFISVFVRGELVSVTPDQIDAGANAFAILSGADVPEIGQAMTVVDEGDGDYLLTDPTRGQLTTEATSHLSGERFVMLGNVVFFPVSDEFTGTTLYFRPVTIGSSAEEATVYSLVYQPADIIIDGGGDG